MNSKKIIFILFLLVSSFSVCAVEYRLAMSKDDNLCNYIKSTYENAPRKYSDIDYEKVDMFSSIGRKKIPVKKSDFESEYAVFDIDNDGVDDYVVRYITTSSGLNVHNISAGSNKISLDKGFYIKDIKLSKKRISMAGWPYRLKGFNERPVAGGFDATVDEYYGVHSYRLSPFLFSGKYYLVLQDYPRGKGKIWSVVVKYHGGNIDGIGIGGESSKLSDWCYLEMIK